MSFTAIATDYDETLACHGTADHQALAALRQLRLTGRRLLLVTGREQTSLQSVFPELGLFDVVVAENGGVLYFPASGQQKILSSPAPVKLIARLHSCGVRPLSVGKCVVATLVTNEEPVRQILEDLHLNWQTIRNRESLMILPAYVDKGSGFLAALHELGLTAGEVMGIGDAENDHAFLRLCGCAVAVANAVSALKAEADLITQGVCGAGVVEAVHHLLSASDIT